MEHSREQGRGDVEWHTGSSGQESGKGKEEGSTAPPMVSYLHLGAFAFDLHYLLREPIDFKGDELSVADSFPRVEGNWDLQCLPRLYHVHTEVHLNVWGVGV